MLEYNVLDKYASSSSFCKTAENGMVCTSNYLAADVGAQIMRHGGNAVDGAVATAAALTVLEPVSNGIGSDAFAIVWMNNNLYGMNASGRAPHNITSEKIKAMGFNEMPSTGWLPVIVPGAPKAWAELVEKFGNLPLSIDLEPAIKLAEEGFTLSPALAYLWNKYVNKHYSEFVNKPEHEEWFRIFTKNSKPYLFGDHFENPDLAKTLKLIGTSNADEFYKGEIAEEFIRESNQFNGFFERRDLTDYQVEWVKPISINYRGIDVFELPPNGQGIVALMALNILRQFNLAEMSDVDRYHYQFEAMKMAFSDGFQFITDPSEMSVDIKRYLEDQYGAQRASQINENAIIPKPLDIPRTGTVYLCTADPDGNMVSYIQSNYQDFGSGIVLKGYGVSLENRGRDFSLDPSNANYLKGGKRSYHTIIPGFLMDHGKPLGPFGVMGGYMQPQGHVQVLTNLIDLHDNPQKALDMPRWQYKPQDGTFFVEPDFPEMSMRELKKRDHIISRAGNCFSFGRGQMILNLNEHAYIGACEARTDSGIACW